MELARKSLSNERQRERETKEIDVGTHSLMTDTATRCELIPETKRIQAMPAMRARLKHALPTSTHRTNVSHVSSHVTPPSLAGDYSSRSGPHLQCPPGQASEHAVFPHQVHPQDPSRCPSGETDQGAGGPPAARGSVCRGGEEEGRGFSSQPFQQGETRSRSRCWGCTGSG